MSIRGRLRQLETAVRLRGCPLCRGVNAAVGVLGWLDPGDGTEPPPRPTCPRCGLVGLLVRYHVVTREEPEEVEL